MYPRPIAGDFVLGNEICFIYLNYSHLAGKLIVCMYVVGMGGSEHI